MAEEETQDLDAEAEQSARNTMLQEAIEALRKNDPTRARDLLTRLLKTEQDNASYWVWLSAAVESKKERIYCLQSALKLDPENVSAKRGLVLFGALPPDDSIKPFPLRKREWEETLKHEEDKPKGFKGAWANPLARAFIILGIGVVVLGLVAVILGPRLQIPTSKIFARPPTRTPGPSPTFTATPTTWGANATDGQGGTPAFVGPTPLWMLLTTTYTPTPRYVVTDHPPESKDAFKAALASFDKGQYDTAIFQFQQVLTMEKGASDAYFYIGECYRALGKYEEALVAYRRSVEINTVFVPGYVGQALAEMGLNPKRDVRGYLEQAISIDPQYEPAYVVRAMYYLANKNPTRALDDLQLALEKNPNDPLIYLYQAQAYLVLEKNSEALAAAKQANEKDKTLLAAYLVLGQAFIANGQPEDAVAPLGTYIQFAPNDVAASIMLGTAYNAAGNYTAAIGIFNKVLNNNKKNADAYCQRGYSYLLLEEWGKAVTDFSQAINYNPNIFEAYIGLGRAYLMGDQAGNAYSALSQNNVPRLADTDEKKAQLYYWTAVALEKISVERKDPSSKVAANNFWRNLLKLPADAMPPEWRAEAEKNLYGGSPTPSPTQTVTETPQGSPSPTTTETPVGTPTQTTTVTPTRTPTPTPTPK
jgi:tetratricopeptide (TPR) repeat protein